MERASTIHLYTLTPPLTCDGRRESQHVDTDRRRESQYVDTNGRRESQHVDTKRGNNNFTINCKNQDSNSRHWALIPCHQYATYIIWGLKTTYIVYVANMQETP
jgi:hypothetical protein